MPVSVSLERLVSLPLAQSLWPAEFAQFVLTIAEDVNERTPWLALADWLKDEGEDDMEAACRYVAKRTEIVVRFRDYNWGQEWLFDNLPPSVNACQVEDCHHTTLPGAIAELAAKLRKHANEGV